MADQDPKKSRRGPASPARRRFLKSVTAAVVTAGVAAPVYGHECEAEHLEVVRRDIHVQGWPRSLAGLRIGQLSDLHCQDDRAVDRTARATRLLVAEKPDVVLLTGDYISGSHSSDWAAPCARALAPLASAPRGVFASLGNHDWYGGRPDIIAGELARVGFHVLRNGSAPLPGAPDVWLVGLDSVSMHRQDVAAALSGVPPAAAKVLLAHEPDFADSMPPGFLFQLSGHSHAGQVRLPGLPPLHCPELGKLYPEGWQRTTRHPVYTTRGVGMMGPQVRLFCPPEVTVLTVQPAG